MSTVSTPIAKSGNANANAEPRAETAGQQQRPWRQGVYTFADQAVVSLTSALTTIIVGRTCSIEELGVFVFGISLMWRIVGLPAALVWSPYVSRAVHLSPAAARRYAGSSAAITLLLACGMAAALLLAWGVVALVALATPVPEWITRLMLAMVPLLIGITLREHARRTSIADFRGHLLLMLDLPIGVLQIASLLLLWHWKLLDSVTALLTVAATSMLSIAWFIGEWPRVAVRWRMTMLHLRSNFGFGIWLLAIAAAWLLCDLLLRSMLTGFHGIEAMGTYGAAYTMVGLTNPLVIAATVFSRSWASRILADKHLPGLCRFAALGSCIALLLAIIATTLLTLCGEWIIQLLFDSKYATQYVVGAVTLGFSMQAVVIPAEAALMALERGRELFAASVLRVGCVVVFGIPLVWWQGAAGIGWTTALQSLVVLAFMWSTLIRCAEK